MKEEYGGTHRWGKGSGLPVDNRPAGLKGAGHQRIVGLCGPR
jgi:hypothetical protein